MNELIIGNLSMFTESKWPLQAKFKMADFCPQNAWFD